MRNKQVRLYNVLFPLWFLMIFPVTWLIVLPGNFLIDSLVLIVTLRVLKITDKKAWYKRYILKIFSYCIYSCNNGYYIFFCIIFSKRYANGA